MPFDIEWVVLTMGDRPEELAAAVHSLLDESHANAAVVVVSNGAGRVSLPCDRRVRLVELPENLGIPGGRHAGVQQCSAPIVGFLDDDAVAPVGASAQILEEFDWRRRLGAVSLRLVDEDGCSARRHVPRLRGTSPEQSGEVALFLGGASAIRRQAYEEVGGYFTELFYGHEEVELSWRLVDARWHVRYLADVRVFHPRTEIGRHASGWSHTGRNRVWIARRTLPVPVAAVHVMAWLVLGVVRAPDRACRRNYVAGWWSGWCGEVRRAPISWSAVWRLTRLGRPPLI